MQIFLPFVVVLIASTFLPHHDHLPEVGAFFCLGRTLLLAARSLAALGAGRAGAFPLTGTFAALLREFAQAALDHAMVECPVGGSPAVVFFN